MKKVLSILLALLMVVFLAACAKTSEKPTVPETSYQYETNNNVVSAPDASSNFTDNVETSPSAETVEVQIWDGSLADSLSGSGTEGDPFLIYTAEELAFFADGVRSGSEKYSRATVQLMNDIRLNDLSDFDSWDITPPANIWLGIGDGNHTFRGTFLGNNHTISGVYINSEDKAGLFPYLDLYFTSVRDLRLTDSLIIGKEEVGGFFGDAIGFGDLTNLINEADVRGGEYTGGIAGHIGGLDPSNCINRGNVEGTTYVGGIAGHGQEGLSECVNYGNITGENKVGGLYGEVLTSDGIEHSGNFGTIIATGKYHDHGTDNGIAGGIVGYAEQLDDLQYCFNMGAVSGGDYVGGLVGFAYYITAWRMPIYEVGIYYCYNAGDLHSYEDHKGSYVGGLIGAFDNNCGISQSYNAGSVSGETESCHCGGIIGDARIVDTFVDCYQREEDPDTLKKYSNDDCRYGLLSSEEMKQESSYVGFDFDTVWKMGTDDYCFPIFK